MRRGAACWLRYKGSRTIIDGDLLSEALSQAGRLQQYMLAQIRCNPWASMPMEVWRRSDKDSPGSPERSADYVRIRNAAARHNADIETVCDEIDVFVGHVNFQSNAIL
ncbi:hypothetical protein [Paraburkholderia sp. J12]|uniref:hypothetical protein n=1 Tax=Paraburkholderia sp. J12 TaxID=2805432 RepID=UPI002ABD7136|nr:hypothetical protein [Paraburkholderia sp. J12]